MKNRIIDILTKTTIAAVAFTSIGIGSAAFAQNPGEFSGVSEQASGQAFTYKKSSHKHHAKKRHAHLGKRLNLSPVQRKAMRKVMASQRKDVRALRQLHKGDRQAFKKALRVSHKSHMKQAKGILTTKQFKQFKRIRKAKHANKRMARMSKRLNLTAAQQTQIKAIRKANHKQARALIKGAKGNRAAVKPQLKALRQNTRQSVLAILTPVQKAKMKTLRAQRAQLKG